MKTLACINAILLFIGTLSAENYQYSSEPSYKDSSMPNYQDSSRQTYQENTSFKNTSESTVKVANNPQLGKILTDSRGMTLYIFTPDKSNTSTCYDQCAVTWPPLLVTNSSRPFLDEEITGTLDVIKRRDNTSQVTYNGMPLYYYIKDKKPGDVHGQNVENKWFVVNPTDY